MKECKLCLVEKDEGEFYVDRTRKGGFTRLCKVCEKKVAVERYFRRKSGIVFSKRNPIDSFWGKVDKRGEDECWEWKGALHGRGRRGCPLGYGVIMIKGKSIRAHRFSYELHRGTIDPDLLVCHSCDNTLCVNPKHLWQGTNLDNMVDMWSKGRGKLPTGKIANPMHRIKNTK